MTKDFQQQLINSFKQLVPTLREAEIGFLLEGVRQKVVPKKEFLFREAAIHREIAFVAKGLFRSYYIDQKGKDITVQFTREGGYATHYYSFIRQIPSAYAIQCLEEATVLTLSYELIQTGYQKYPQLERYGRLIAEEVLVAQQQRIEGFIFKTAEQRYLEFMSSSPELYHRISLSHLASYLGIERPSLSRIRKRISESGTL